MKMYQGKMDEICKRSEMRTEFAWDIQNDSVKGVDVRIILKSMLNKI